jgi:hypothetical protein
LARSLANIAANIPSCSTVLIVFPAIVCFVCRWLSLLNCFSGGVFLAAGLVHLLPHCQESQERLAGLVGDYPLYLVLITLGYMLVLFVERVLFDVHGSAHGHGPHTGRHLSVCVVHLRSLLCLLP